MVMGTFWARQDEGSADSGGGDTSNGGGDTGSGVSFSTDSGVAPVAVSDLTPLAELQAPSIGVFQQDRGGNWIPLLSGSVSVNTPLLIRITGYEVGAVVSLTITDPMGVQATQVASPSIFGGTNDTNFTPQTAGIYQVSATGNTSLLGAVVFFLPDNARVTTSFTVVGGGANGPVRPSGPVEKPGLADISKGIGGALKTGGFIALGLVGLLVLYNLTKGKS